MSAASVCAYVEATACSGSPGPSPIWVNTKAFTGPFKAAGGVFTSGGSCYALPAMPAAVAEPPAGSAYATPPIGEISGGCADCCGVTPGVVYLDCTGTGTASFHLAGPAGSTLYLAWESCWLVVNGVGPSPGGGSTAIEVAASGATFTVATSAGVCPAPCPGGSASITVGKKPGGDECGTVEINLGCPPCPSSPQTLSAAVSVPYFATSSGYGCNSANLQPVTTSCPLTCNAGVWQGYGGYGTHGVVVVGIGCVSGTGSYGTNPGQLYWSATIHTGGAPLSWYCHCECGPGFSNSGNWQSYTPVESALPTNVSGATIPIGSPEPPCTNQNCVPSVVATINVSA